MLYSSFLVSALLALSTSVAAAPSAPTSTEFTFAQWIEDIIADPTGSHLSPAEAVAAKNAAVASNTLGKRINCDQSWGRANVRSRYPFALSRADNPRPTTQQPASPTSPAKAQREHSA